MKRNFKDFLLFFNVKILSFYAPLRASFSAFPLLVLLAFSVPLPLFLSSVLVYSVSVSSSGLKCFGCSFFFAGYCFRHIPSRFRVAFVLD